MRLRQQESARRSVEAEAQRRSYKDFVHTRRDPETNEPVWPIKMLHERNGL